MSPNVLAWALQPKDYPTRFSGDTLKWLRENRPRGLISSPDPEAKPVNRAPPETVAHLTPEQREAYDALVYHHELNELRDRVRDPYFLKKFQHHSARVRLLDRNAVLRLPPHLQPAGAAYIPDNSDEFLQGTTGLNMRRGDRLSRHAVKHLTRMTQENGPHENGWSFAQRMKYLDRLDDAAQPRKPLRLPEALPGARPPVSTEPKHPGLAQRLQTFKLKKATP